MLQMGTRKVFFDAGHSLRILLYEYGLHASTAQRFDAQRTSTGEQVQYTGIIQHSP